MNNRSLKIILLTFLLPLGGLAAQTLNKVVTDRKTGKEVLVGYCDREGLQGELFGSYYEEEYRSYEPDLATLAMLRKVAGQWEATIVLGTWCSDSQREVPRFYRILDEMGEDQASVFLIGVDRMKEADEVDIRDLEISLVPTFIFCRDGKEIGRIIESPAESLEKDMLSILSRPPKPPAPGTR